MRVQNNEYTFLAVSKHIDIGIGHYTMIYYENKRFFEVNNMAKAIVYPDLKNKNRNEQFKFVFYYRK